MSLVKDKDGTINIRLVILLIVILTGAVAAIFYFPPVPTRTAEALTNGSINFTDKMGNAIPGIIEVSIANATKKTRENANSVNWNGIPDARISFNALETAHVSLDFRISGDSPDGKVTIEDYGMNLPGNTIRNFPSGSPIRYVEISQQGVSFSEAVITIKYQDIELRRHDETSLSIYRYDGKNWVELPSIIDTTQNTVSATVNELSVFALVAKPSGNIEIIDTGKAPVVSEISTYDENRQLIKKARTDSISSADVPSSGDIEVNALQTKNVAVRLKLKASGGGKVILDDHGRKNPVYEAAPGNAIKYVDISAPGFSFESAEVRIHYTDEELGQADENALVIYHWNGASWEALPTTVDAVNNVLTATTTSLSPFGVSTSYGYINAMVARKVILDEPWGTNTDPWNPENTNGRNWENGQSVTQYVYGVVISNYGFPIQGASVSGNYTAANGSTNLFPFSGTTDIFGEFNFSTLIDNQVRIGQTTNAQGPNEGVWNVTINVSYNGTTTIIKRDFRLGEYGCGRSGSGCHGPGGTTVQGKGGAITDDPAYSNDPYIQGVIADGKTGQSTHMVYQPTGTEHHAPTDTVGGTDCTTCHRGYNQTGYITTNAFLNNATPLSTNDLHETNNVYCKNCHGNITIGGVSQLKYQVPQCYDSNCHSNTVNIPKTWVQSRTDSYSWNQHAHDTNQTIACILCHGPYHNISKPNVTYAAIDNTPNGVTESEYCLNNCHKSQRYHNGTLQCTVCHSQAAHEIRFFNSTGDYTYNKTQNLSGWNVGRAYAGKCSTCHQKPYFANLLNHTNNASDLYDVVNGSYSKGASGSKLVSDPLTHSNAPNNGSKWGNYWNTSNDSASCMYCHGIVYNNVGYSFTEDALGHVWQFMGNNTVNSTMSSSTYWCAGCHWQGYTSGTKTYNDMVNSFLSDNDLVPPEITGNATYGANQSIAGYFNHTSVNKDDATCKGCHGSLTSSTTMTGFMHNVAIGAGGGPDCISCHDYGKTGSGHRINNSAMNSSPAIHRNLNSNASNSSNVSAENKKCWGCHTSNGTQPTDMGDRYANPYKCYDCHNTTAKPYSNVSNALNVSEHFKNGTDIRAGTSAIDNSTSCTICHNLSEMKVSYTEDDTFGTNYSFSSHYGRNRSTDPLVRNGTSTNCTYCHQNLTTAFTVAMIDPSYNSSIGNHSLRYNSSNPGCTVPQCHNSGWLHNATLTKPNLTMENSTFCLNCHGSNGSGGTNYTGAVTGIKAMHNNSVNCTECHLNTSRDIHPVKYLQANASYNTSNSTGVNCVICHQGTAVDSNLSKTPPKIPNPLHHSDNLSNGSIWGPYWTNNSPQTACIYCHNDTKHNATPLGRILQWQPNYSTYRPIGSNYTCSDCHYRGDLNYSQMNASFISAGLPIPPEITNGTSWNGTGSGYYNHTLSDYVDVNCKTCHGKLLNASANMSDFLHNVSKGGDCKGCHFDYTFMNSSGKPGRYVNSTMYNNSPHVNLRCEDCHTQGHNNIGARKACEDCHAYQSDPKNQTDRHNITGDPLNYTIGAVSVVNITDCTICHDAGLYANATSTYGYTKTRDCDYCHTYPDKTYP